MIEQSSRVTLIFLRNQSMRQINQIHNKQQRTQKQNRKNGTPPPANLNENKRQREALLPGLEPTSTNPKLHTSYCSCISLGQAYCAFIHFRKTKKSRITQGTLPQTWTIVYLKPVPAQERQSFCGEPRK